MTKDIKTTELIRTSQSWDGAMLPDFPQGQPELRVIRLDFPIGAKTGWHHHTVVNYGIVQQGDLTIVCQDGTEKTFHEGEALVEVIGTIHRGENRGSKPVILNMFYFSSPGAEITIQHPSRGQQQDRKDQTAPLIGEGDMCFRSPQESKIIGDPNRKANKPEQAYKLTAKGLEQYKTLTSFEG